MSRKTRQARRPRPDGVSPVRARPVPRCDGRSLKQVVAAAAQWLRNHTAVVNALNVFPVPDGDTGTNMSLTMAAALTEIERSPADSVSAVARALAHGGLMGARGNSGVILSQILRGFAHALDGKESFSAPDLADAAQEAYDTALRGVIKPVEGTILTVMRATAEALRAGCAETDDLAAVLARAVEAARETNQRTPEMLPVLKEAGVVDAGGQGLVYLLEGALRWVRGESVEVDTEMEAAVDLKAAPDGGAEGFGYDVQFLIKGRALDVDEIRRVMNSLGESVIVVGDARLVKVHVHVPDPSVPIAYGVRQGTLADVVVENMQEQYQRFAARRDPLHSDVEEMTGISIICVASGEGLVRIVESTHAVSKIVPGGNTMNPSIQEILAAIESVRADKVIVLPNNANVVPAARQASQLARKQVAVIPTHSIPQGIAALLAFNYQADFETNVGRMAEQAAAIQTIEITHAVRSTQVNGMQVSHGDVIGLLNDRLVATGREDLEVTLQVLETASADDWEIATIYFGEDVDAAQADRLAQAISGRFPSLEVEVHDGGQPHYRYIISLE